MASRSFVHEKKTVKEKILKHATVLEANPYKLLQEQKKNKKNLALTIKHNPSQKFRLQNRRRKSEEKWKRIPRWRFSFNIKSAAFATLPTRHRLLCLSREKGCIVHVGNNCDAKSCFEESFESWAKKIDNIFGLVWVEEDFLEKRRTVQLSHPRASAENIRLDGIHKVSTAQMS